MDPFSHAIVGAITANNCLVKRVEQMRLATLVAVTSAMAPDLDVLIRSHADSLLAVEYHRHFTHSIAFVPVGALLMAGLWWGVLARKFRAVGLSFGVLWCIAACAMLTHGLLDAATSYGTRLGWPFSNTRVAWSIIAIVDPLFTLPLLALLLMAVIKRSQRILRFALCFMVFYLSVGVVQSIRVGKAMERLAAERGHVIERVNIQPTIFNLVVWRGVYESGGKYYADGYRAGLNPEVQTYVGSALPVYHEPSAVEHLSPTTQLKKDIARFMFFSGGFVTNHPQNPLLLVDVRYGALPNSFSSLWGLRLTPDALDAFQQFVSLRDGTAPEEPTPLTANAPALWRMVKGE